MSSQLVPVLSCMPACHPVFLLDHNLNANFNSKQKTNRQGHNLKSFEVIIVRKNHGISNRAMHYVSVLHDIPKYNLDFVIF